MPIQKMDKKTEKENKEPKYKSKLGDELKKNSKVK